MGRRPKKAAAAAAEQAAGGAGDDAADASAAPQSSRVSQRQASRGTIDRMRLLRHDEELAFAAFERATAERMRQGKRPAPQPAAAAGTATGTASSSAVGPDGEVVMVVKKRRGRAPKPRPPEPPKPAVMGPRLDAVLADVRAAVSSSGLAPGTPVWVKITGYCAWPGLVWSLDLCARFIWPDIISSYQQDKVLVRYYGDHSNSWVSAKQLLPWDEGDAPAKSAALTQWGKKNSRVKLVAATLDELAARSDDPAEELCRMDRLGRQYQLDSIKAAARHRHNALLRPANAAGTSGAAAAGGGAGRGLRLVSEKAAAAAASADTPVTGNAWGTCDICREEMPDLRCSSCHRWLHALCVTSAALTAAEYPADQCWTCPCCKADNTSAVLPEEDLLRQAGSQGDAAERAGLTPDWIIATTAFTVFQLPRPTADVPYIAGLLDPACNSKAEPNIPAEVLYTKEDDGLDPNNSWKGYYILLNPDYRAQVQWRFVNRAIDEVENGNVPAVLLVCRNSTDTAYYQRLRPYPRVLLRRCNTQFKDYEKCPIGFGVVAFCIATTAHPNCQELFQRFYQGFSAFGEPNIPIDTEFLMSPPFYQLLARLRLHAEQHARVQWAQCGKCGVWRIISWQQQQDLLNGKTAEWTCSMLRPPLTSCATPQTKRELTGVAALEPTQSTAPAEPAAAAAASGAAAAASGAAASPPGLQLALPAPPPAGRAAHAQAQLEAVLPPAGTAAGSAQGEPDAAADQLLPSPPPGEAAAAAAAAAAPAAMEVDDARDPSTRNDLQLLDQDAPADSKGGSNTPQAASAAPAGRKQSQRLQRLSAAVDASDAAAAGEGAQAAAAAASAAADMLAVFAEELSQLQGDIAVAYLCKSAAGQITIQQARGLLEAAGHRQPPAQGAADTPPAQLLPGGGGGAQSSQAAAQHEGAGCEEGGLLSCSGGCPGLSVLAPVALMLVKQWLQQLVLSLVVQVEQQQQQQQQQQEEAGEEGQQAERAEQQQEGGDAAARCSAEPDTAAAPGIADDTAAAAHSKPPADSADLQAAAGTTSGSADETAAPAAADAAAPSAAAAGQPHLPAAPGVPQAQPDSLPSSGPLTPQLQQQKLVQRMLAECRARTLTLAPGGQQQPGDAAAGTTLAAAAEIAAAAAAGPAAAAPGLQGTRANRGQRAASAGGFGSKAGADSSSLPAKAAVTSDSDSSRSLLLAAFGSAQAAGAPATPPAAASGGAATRASREASTSPAAAAGTAANSPSGKPSGAAYRPQGPAVLRPRGVWDLTRDPLLRALLLEQPCLLEGVLAMLKRMAAALQPSSQQGALAGPGQQQAGGAGGGDGDGARLSYDTAAAAAATGGVPALSLVDVNVDALDSLCSQPMKTDGGAWPKRPQGQPQCPPNIGAEGDALGDDDAEVFGVAAEDDTGADEAEMLSSLELARAARMAANKAYMLGLGLGQPIGSAAAAGGPSFAPLAATDSAVIAAARQLAQQAAVQRARRQLDASQRLLDARRRARRQQEKRLRATLDALTADEAAAAQQVLDAKRTLQDMQQEAHGR